VTFTCVRPRKTRNALLAFALGAALLGNAPAADPANALDTLLDSVQKHYDGVKDMRAQFEQESLVKALGKRDVSRGDVAFKRPGRMRWNYAQPEVRVLTVAPDAVRMFSASDKQLQIAPVGQGVSPTALDFLLGEADLRESFEAARIEDATRKDVGLKLTPRGDTSFESLELWLEPASLKLRESVLVDLFGNRTVLRFSELVENAGVEDGAFEIQVPKDTEVIDLR
jgi:outer membrane lipoprotein carrier protein